MGEAHCCTEPSHREQAAGSGVGAFVSQWLIPSSSCFHVRGREQPSLSPLSPEAPADLRRVSGGAPPDVCNGALRASAGTKAAKQRIVIENSACLQGKQIFSSKMTLQVLVLCLAYSGLGKTNVVPQAGHTEVRMGDNATLRCALTEPKDVLQVTWQKGSEESNENIATYSIANGLKIHEPYKDRMNFTSLELDKTSIIFWHSRMDDSGHYKCLFNVFPDGSYSGNIYLRVFGLNASVHHKISDDRLIVTCNAHGLPEPTITWNNLFNSTPSEKTVKHENGIVSITSRLEIYNIPSVSARDLTCRVSNTNETVELPVKIKGEEGSSLPWIIAVLVVITIVTIVLIMMFWKKIPCRRS